MKPLLLTKAEVIEGQHITENQIDKYIEETLLPEQRGLYKGIFFGAMFSVPVWIFLIRMIVGLF